MRPWLLVGAILAATAVTYGPTVDGELVHDDLASVANNPHLRDLGNVGRLFTDSNTFSVEGSSHTRPVLLISFALDYAVSDAAWTFKLVNLALHLINVVLLFLLARVVLRGAGRERGADRIAAIAAAIFSVHPLNTQAVVYVSSRSALLAFTFYVCALLAFVRWRAAAHATGRSRAVHVAVFLACQVLAMLSKEHAVSLIGAVVLLEVALFRPAGGRPRWRDVLRVASIAAAPVALYFAYRAGVTGHRLTHAGPPTGQTTKVAGAYVWHLLTQAKALLVYLRLFFWPVGNALQHPVAHVHSLADPGAIAGGALLVAGLGWGFARWWRRGCLIATGGLVFLCAMAPESLVRLNMAVNEHRFYLPAIGFVPVVAWLADRLYRAVAGRSAAAGRAAVVTGVIALAVLAWQARGYGATFATECAIWARGVEVEPGDSWTQNNHGNCRLMAHDLAGAETAYRRALELSPGNNPALYNLSLVVEEGGRWGEALELLRAYDRATGGRNRAIFVDRLARLQALSGQRW